MRVNLCRPHIFVSEKLLRGANFVLIFEQLRGEAVAFYAEDVFVDSPDFAAPKRTPKEVAENYRNYFASTSGIKDDVTNIIASGNKVIVEFVSSGTIQNLAPDDPPIMKGKKFSLKICSISEIKNGKVVRDITYYDQISFLKQVGLA